MVSKINSMGFLGIDSFVVKVEADVSAGLPSFDVVGLPDAAVKESRNRVRSAIKNCGFEYPVSKITVNLAPADVKKEGSIYDLPIFIALLKSSRQIKLDNDKDSVFIGELSLSGDVNAVSGVLPMVIKARMCGYKKIFVPTQNSKEAGVVAGIDIYPVKNVNELIDHINSKVLISPQPQTKIKPSDYKLPLDFCQVKGQYNAKRALEIAASGGHNALLIGPPGSGKSMLAKRIPSILPDMTFDEMIETTNIHSIAGILTSENPLIFSRPFRAPHHTISPAGLSGGGSIPHPGELSLAHNGVLFLDELPEFSRTTMEVMRQPIEEGQVTIARVKTTLTYPCSVILIGAMNPCPCGYFGHIKRSCNCSSMAVSKYLSKVSGPLLDRFDLHIDVPAVDFENMSCTVSDIEISKDIKDRVDKSRKIQNERYKNQKIKCNAKISSDILQEVCEVTSSAKEILKNAFDSMGLSARAYDKILRVARTIADLDNCKVLEAEHVSEAVQYRSLDRKYWYRNTFVS